MLEVCLKDFGFPGHILPKLHMKYQAQRVQQVQPTGIARASCVLAAC